MTTEYKDVTYKHLKKGQQIHGHKLGSMASSYHGTIKDINPAYVTVLIFGTREEKIPSEEALFSVQMSEEEFRAKYHAEAVTIMKALQNKLANHEIGAHEMWNGWVSYDPYEMAKECKHHKLKVIGVCEDVWQRLKMFDTDDSKDIGICVEEDNCKFWCHASESYIADMLEEYKELLEQ